MAAPERSASGAAASFCLNPSGQYGGVGNAGKPEEAAVTLGFGRIAQGLRVVIRELDSRAAVYIAQFTNQADGVESIAALRVAVAEVVGQQRAPSGAEAD